MDPYDIIFHVEEHIITFPLCHWNNSDGQILQQLVSNQDKTEGYNIQHMQVGGMRFIWKSHLHGSHTIEEFMVLPACRWHDSYEDSIGIDIPFLIWRLIQEMTRDVIANHSVILQLIALLHKC